MVLIRRVDANKDFVAMRFTVTAVYNSVPVHCVI